MINWSNYFDKIICINHSQFKIRKQLMQNQLNRVGILNSGIFEWEIAYNGSFEKQHASIFDESEQFTYFTICLSYLNAIKKAYYNGYKNLLIMNDNIRFLKDLNYIEKVLNNFPKEDQYDILFFDKKIQTKTEWNLIKQQTINDYFSKINKITSSSCYVLSRNGMKIFLQICNENKTIHYEYFFNILNTLNLIKQLCTTKSLCISCLFKYENNEIEKQILDNSIKINTYNLLYTNQQINYNDYMILQDSSYNDFYIDFYINKQKELNKSMIDWTKYYDKIYCINFCQYTKRKQLMQFELNRVGILNSGIFEWYFTTNRSLDKEFENYLHNKFNYCLSPQDSVSLTLGHYNVFKDAYFKGYNRILIIEDDMRFLKDLNLLKQILQHRPENMNLILYDKFVFNLNTLPHFTPVNDYFSIYSQCCSSGCYELDRIGMQKMLQKLEKQIHAMDYYFYECKTWLVDMNYCYSKLNLAIQTCFKDTNILLRTNSINSLHEWYKMTKVDYNNYMVRKDGSPYNYGDLVQL